MSPPHVSCGTSHCAQLKPGNKHVSRVLCKALYTRERRVRQQSAHRVTSERDVIAGGQSRSDCCGVTASSPVSAYGRVATARSLDLLTEPGDSRRRGRSSGARRGGAWRHQAQFVPVPQYPDAEIRYFRELSDGPCPHVLTHMSGPRTSHGVRFKPTRSLRTRASFGALGPTRGKPPLVRLGQRSSRR